MQTHDITFRFMMEEKELMIGELDLREIPNTRGYLKAQKDALLTLWTVLRLGAAEEGRLDGEAFMKQVQELFTDEEVIESWYCFFLSHFLH
jgi:hypothetical protein